MCEPCWFESRTVDASRSGGTRIPTSGNPGGRDRSLAERPDPATTDAYRSRPASDAGRRAATPARDIERAPGAHDPRPSPAHDARRASGAVMGTRRVLRWPPRLCRLPGRRPRRRPRGRSPARTAVEPSPRAPPPQPGDGGEQWPCGASDGRPVASSSDLGAIQGIFMCWSPKFSNRKTRRPRDGRGPRRDDERTPETVDR